MEHKKDDDEYMIPFQGIEKGAVVQDRRVFNETPVDPENVAI